jgi:hypothetical protein
MKLNHLKLFEEYSGSKREKAIDGIRKLITTNHKINDKPVIEEVFDLGYKMGELSKKSLMGVRAITKSGFNIERDVIERAAELEPERIDTKRNLVYDGPEITSDDVLVGDGDVKQAIEWLKDKKSEYLDCVFRFNTREEIDKIIKEIDTDDEYFEDEEDEATWILNKYNQSEVSVWLLKLYQIGLSIGQEETDEMPVEVRDYFRQRQMADDFDKSNRISKEEVENVRRRADKMADGIGHDVIKEWEPFKSEK